jgi:hypothetical protein
MFPATVHPHPLLRIFPYSLLCKSDVPSGKLKNIFRAGVGEVIHRNAVEARPVRPISLTNGETEQ